LQGHGGDVAPREVLRMVLAAGARLAEPGEFTRRAFLNGRLDLTQAEAVMDLVQARTARAAQVAQAQLAGQLGSRISACYEGVAALCAEVEARLDFDAEELPQRIHSEDVARAEQLHSEIASLLSTWREGELLRRGALVVIGGCPNAGKSSLMNALLNRERAIVSPHPGTTRDTIEETVELDGIPLRLVDTAGLRQTTCLVEQEGVKRAEQVLSQADLILYLLDGERPIQLQHPRLFDHAFSQDKARVLVIINKIDLSHRQVTRAIAETTFLALNPEHLLEISVRTGEGMDRLRRVLLHRLGLERQAPIHPTVSERHRDELRLAEAALRRVIAWIGSEDHNLVLAAEELRQAAAALGRMTGKEYSQEVLDRIFSAFCIGK